MKFRLRAFAVGWVLLVAVGAAAAGTDPVDRELEAARRELEALRHAVGERTREAAAAIEALERSLAEARSTERALRERIARLEENREAALERAEAAEAELAAMRRAVRAQHRTAEGEIGTLENRLASATSSAERLRRRLDRLRTRNDAFDGEIAALREEADRAHELEKRLQQQEFRIRELEHSRAVDREQVRGLRIERARLEDMMTQVRRRRDESVESLRAIVAQRVAAMPAGAPRPVPPPVAEKTVHDGAATPAEGASRDVADLEHRLDLERERRRTLEGEVQRLHVAVGKAEGYRKAWEELQAARAEILVLTNRLADEKSRRREIEVLMQEAGAEAGTDAAPAETMRRLVEVSREREREATRLEAELREATEAIVRLKGRLEAIGSPEENAAALGDLESENDRLRSDLAEAHKSVERLRAQAELAERLADLVYAER